MESKPAMADKYGFAAKLTLLQSCLISLAMVDRLRVADGFLVIMLVLCGLLFTGFFYLVVHRPNWFCNIR